MLKNRHHIYTTTNAVSLALFNISNGISPIHILFNWILSGVAKALTYKQRVFRTRLILGILLTLGNVCVCATLNIIQSYTLYVNFMCDKSAWANPRLMRAKHLCLAPSPLLNRVPKLIIIFSVCPINFSIEHGMSLKYLEYLFAWVKYVISCRMRMKLEN